MPSHTVIERPPQVVEAPSITLLGSLDDEQGTEGIDLNAEAPAPVLAIIYTGV